MAAPSTLARGLLIYAGMPLKAPKSRRRPHGPTRRVASLLLSLPLGAAAAGLPAARPLFENPAHLAAVAQAAAARALGPISASQRIKLGALAPNLRLRRCDQPVSATRAPGLAVSGRVLLIVRCTGANPWHIYVPATVVGVTPVALAAHAIVAGTVLTASDLSVQPRDMTQLPPGFLDSASIAVGLTAARPIAQGTILTDQMLLGTPAVRRGQTVTLVATTGGISVTMTGRALGDALVNQRIKVENLSSGKIVEGVARSDQTVQILVP